MSTGLTCSHLELFCKSMDFVGLHKGMDCLVHHIVLVRIQHEYKVEQDIRLQMSLTGLTGAGALVVDYY